MIGAIFKFIGGHKWLLIGGAAIASVSFAAAWQMQGWRLGLQIAELESQHWQAEIARKQRVVESQRLQNNIKDLIGQNRKLAEQKQKTVTEYVNKRLSVMCKTLMLVLASLAISGCASTTVQPECPKPTPPQELMQTPPGLQTLKY